MIKTIISTFLTELRKEHNSDGVYDGLLWANLAFSIFNNLIKSYKLLKKDEIKS